MVFEFFKISVNILSIDRAGCLRAGGGFRIRAIGAAVHLFVHVRLYCHILCSSFRSLLGLRLTRDAVLQRLQLCCIIHGNRTILTDGVLANA